MCDTTNRNVLYTCASESITYRQQAFLSYSPAPDIPLQSSSTKNTCKQKAARSRVLYDIRKKLVDCEERRILAIDKLTEAVNENNKIQQERNDILKKLVPRTENS